MVLKGWHTNQNKFNSYFSIDNPTNLLVLQQVKKRATKEIYKKIDEETNISNFIFKGIGNFEEPFTATWFYEKGTLKLAEKIPFTVTTGSGRSKNDFTIVIKPK